MVVFSSQQDPFTDLLASERQIPSLLFLVWSLFVFLTLTVAQEDLQLPPLWMPFVFACLVVAFFINPFRIFHRQARYWLLRTIVRFLIKGSESPILIHALHAGPNSDEPRPQDRLSRLLHHGCVSFF